MIEIVPATMDHARAIDLRDGDAREIAALGVTVEHAVGQSLGRSLHAETYLSDGRVAAIAGLAFESLLGGTGTPWLVTGRPVEQHKREFLTLTRAGVDRMLGEMPVLSNRIHADYAESLRWARWLGFSIYPPQPYGPKGAPFCKAVLRRRGPVIVRPSRVAEIQSAESWPALAMEYADETLIAGMPPPLARWPAYHALEDAGLLSAFGAWDGDTLVGFISILAADLPRYGRRVAMAESFFVARSYRKSGAGLRLLKAGEVHAREIESPGLFVTAPYRGDLFKVLPRLGYDEAARVFFKRLIDA